MTVTYSPRELLVFSHLKGTVLPEVWRMCAFTCALAYALCHIYNPIRRTVRDGGPKTIVRPPPAHSLRPEPSLSAPTPTPAATLLHLPRLLSPSPDP